MKKQTLRTFTERKMTDNKISEKSNGNRVGFGL